MIKFVFFILILISTTTYSQSMDLNPLINQFMKYKANPNLSEADQRLMEVQVFLIKEMFVKPMFETENFGSLSDDEMFMQSNMIYNQLMGNAMAQYLAEQDILKLNKVLKNQRQYKDAGVLIEQPRY